MAPGLSAASITRRATALAKKQKSAYRATKPIQRAGYLAELMGLVRDVLKFRHFRGRLVPIKGKLFYDPRVHTFWFERSKGSFEPVSVAKVVSLYRLGDIESGLQKFFQGEKKGATSRAKSRLPASTSRRRRTRSG